ncbi:MAG: polysaccharide deacetylase family protein [Clostridia bacterium]|nr:polysaccharide deacetylase family protein [Clostridia bacterium]MDE7305896.1 polysaccharide deacetylase family protein [Clostridia bacterium]
MVKVFKLKNILIAAVAAVMIVALSISVYFTGAYAVYFGNTPRLVPIYSVDREDKVVSISFDCAWGVDYTDEILNALRVSNVRATWFMVEFWAEKYPEYVKKIDEAGHEIGTHSSTHSYMSKQNAEEIKLELSTSSEAIEGITGKKVELFRPPYGDYDNELIKTASELGYYTIQWDTDSLDWKDLSATDIAMRVINGVQSGSIILMHNNGLHTAEAVPIILETLKNKGYSFVPIGELIYRENYTVDGTGRQRPAQ